jgi:hypothetical protein
MTGIGIIEQGGGFFIDLKRTANGPGPIDYCGDTRGEKAGISGFNAADIGNCTCRRMPCMFGNACVKMQFTVLWTLMSRQRRSPFQHDRQP